MTTKEDLHRLVEQLPDSGVDAAARYLEYLRDMGDRLLRKLLQAPEEEEELTEKAKASLEEARQEALLGKGRSWEEVRKELAGG